MDVKDGLTLVLGHAASGKSDWAEAAVRATGAAPVYVATAQALDAEMSNKIKAHAARRGPEWRLVEAPLDLAAACEPARDGEVWLIDCATMWLTNKIMADADWHEPAEAWLAHVADSPAGFVVVSNDVGGGVTPDNSLARRFQREQGALNQRLARAADRVVLVTAGLAQRLK
ncbi:bifunctional adenosylcobinamide kinase/adenosylcobinamide-phosphate guanylyltransferase [Jannaschia ovalis]|uniref:Bifunctional adenosylcobalamin biosynthesis protein n=1 Tax=Jannaschia ovalis TaxID=3038773 RepID=A0ABY8LFD9_9RHOB|nr:bifunctional adenosylcobinamide kinase/adenosylcobinamide-phosphate guanylyltransferase [Jannaschia sp. GRR-S6-38]WGH80022.1 bifunctional adenosylcobinamide kinase/adenosylcobinamide-phosphate guanylyltransferase [Jannaschia sp. GRR-S6-38]